ncbi:alanine racemase [Flaviflexus sp.]|uniref:alanine racemase n=1 Tax=Flaviflexus sp. TaxID=1969482 RepID=UPI003F90CA48
MTDFIGRADVDLGALRANYRLLRNKTDAKIAAIVKANGYGHGLHEVGAALADEGVDYLGVAQLSEALELRRTVPDTPILTWIYGTGASLAAAILSNLDISIGARWALEEAVEAAKATGVPARFHIEIDTGMSRGGFSKADLEQTAEDILRAEAAGLVEIIGLWSHLARADEPDSSETSRQLNRFNEASSLLENVGVKPVLRHLANTAGTLWHPDTHLDMVRPGIGLYGLSPDPAVATAEELGLLPVMTLTSKVIAVREVPADTGVSYGHTEVTEEAMRLGTVPLGYADGIPRSASGRGPVRVGGIRTRVVGRVCMDQVVIALPEGVEAGAEVVFYGHGGPTADEWASAAGTIGYEITTRLGRHVPRTYRGKVGH